VKENIFKRGSQIFKFIVNGWGVFFRGVRRRTLDQRHTLPPVFFNAIDAGVRPTAPRVAF
jgi:hypothetical protein